MIENIKIVPPREGLFCQINCCLIAYAEYPNHNVYIDMGNSRYSESNENAFLNFFKKNWNDEYKFSFVDIVKKWDKYLSFHSFFPYGRKSLGMYSNRLSPLINNIYTDNSYVGVHVRRTDHIQDTPYLDDDVYFSEIDNALNSYEYVYLATDENNFLNKAIDRYGDILKYQNCKRSDGKIGVHKKYKGVEIGKEVMYDAYSLSNCGSLIHTMSNVSYFALINNLNLKSISLDNFLFHK